MWVVSDTPEYAKSQKRQPMCLQRFGDGSYSYVFVVERAHKFNSKEEAEDAIAECPHRDEIEVLPLERARFRQESRVYLVIDVDGGIHYYYDGKGFSLRLDKAKQYTSHLDAVGARLNCDKMGLGFTLSVTTLASARHHFDLGNNLYESKSLRYR
jgi:hypothetical protein